MRRVGCQPPGASTAHIFGFSTARLPSRAAAGLAAGQACTCRLCFAAKARHVVPLVRQLRGCLFCDSCVSTSFAAAAWVPLLRQLRGYLL